MLKKIILIILLAITSSIGFGHGNHEAVTAEQALNITKKVTFKMTKKNFGLEVGKLPKSWATLKIENFEVMSEKKGFYIISVINKASPKTLFFLVAKNGEVYDANFSGEFEGINK